MILGRVMMIIGRYRKGVECEGGGWPAGAGPKKTTREVTGRRVVGRGVCLDHILPRNAVTTARELGRKKVVVIAVGHRADHGRRVRREIGAVKEFLRLPELGGLRVLQLRDYLR